MKNNLAARPAAREQRGERTAGLSIRQRIVVWLLVVTALVAADRLLKWYAIAHWSLAPADLGFGFGFTFLVNPGIAFSIPFGGTVLLVVTIVVLSLFCRLLWRAVAAKNMRAALASATVLVGAGSNIADRFLYGGVVDYLGLGPFSVVNLADLMILAGIVMLIVGKREEGKR